MWNWYTRSAARGRTAGSRNPAVAVALGSAALLTLLWVGSATTGGYSVAVGSSAPLPVPDLQPTSGARGRRTPVYPGLSWESSDEDGAGAKSSGVPRGAATPPAFPRPDFG